MLISIHYSEIKCYLINDQISKSDEKGGENSLHIILGTPRRANDERKEHRGAVFFSALFSDENNTA
jgi:hypothetical protein